MTAEIAVLNKAAVALAADSTVTVGAVDNPRKVKTYQTANKLFTLSKLHPIGAMIYGNAGLMDLPWETLIKQYRKELGKKHFATISDYSADFIRFLEQATKLFPDELQREYFTSTVYAYLRNRVLPAVKEQVKKTLGEKKATATEIGAIHDDVIQGHWDEMSNDVGLSPNLDAKFEETLKNSHKKEVADAVNAVFPGIPLSDNTRERLTRIAARIVCGEMFPETVMSGVVIAGFGEEQFFPEVKTFSPHFVCQGKLIYREEPDESHEVTHGDNSALIPFAQKDVVGSFLRGIDSRYLAIVQTALDELSNDYPNVVAQHINEPNPVKKAEIVAKITNETRKVTDTLEQRLDAHRDREHINPLLAVIGALPKNELAELAEALVNLTSLKRKMSNELETVGGPIDVAVISKGDGFIWIRRKHYFKPELNPHFTRNYLRGLEK